MKIELFGILGILIVWYGLVATNIIQSRILPSPITVFTSFGELIAGDHLFKNLGVSLGLNLLGYIEAVAIAIPLGFCIGLFPIFRGLFERPISAIRGLPLSAVLGLFILWFGISTNMKVQFLTLGVLVYLLPVVVQRIDEVKQIYVDTVKTLGANRWQTIRKVFIPDVLSRVSDDIRVLLPIAWTYIIMAEVINKSEGGIGALAYTAGRQSRPDKVFAILAMIILVVFLQDKLFLFLDRKFFKHKYV
jgi:NitT/TauT family transport system permease protein